VVTIQPSAVSPSVTTSAERERDNSAFTATVSAITNAFGDPTRRAIYLFARSSDRGVTAAQVASQFGLHPNVARHHLDRLAAGGYLEVAVERAEGSGAGRPSKHYRTSSEALPDVPVRSDDLVLTLLGKALALLPREQAEAMAEQVGREYGATMAAGLTGNDVAAGQRSLRSALHAVADALTAHGFAAHTDHHNDQLRIVNNHCPFGEVAIEHPVICAVDRGMVKGMLAALYGGDTEPSLQESLPMGDTFCATAV
jgi:predicted ArsR family transcriptional regulator